MSNELLKAAITRNKANEAFKTAFRAEMRSLKPMHDDEHFNGVLDALSKMVQQGRKSGRDMESVMHNFMCACVYQTYGEVPDAFDDLSQPVAWELMARFHNRYETVKATLSKVMWEMKGLSRSDDSYGDLIDSLPLAGREIIDRIVTEDIATYKQLEKALADHPLKDFILHGENYVEMKLEEALEKAFLSVARDAEFDEDEDRPRENPHCVVQMVPIKERSYGDTMGVQLNVVGPFRDHWEADKYLKQEEKDGMVVKLYGGTVLK